MYENPLDYMDISKKKFSQFLPGTYAAIAYFLFLYVCIGIQKKMLNYQRYICKVIKHIPNLSSKTNSQIVSMEIKIDK